MYIGIACGERDKLSTQFQTLQGSFLGSFPGARLSLLDTEKNEELLNSVFGEPGIRIAAVSALSASKADLGDSKGQGYGFEHLTDGMYGKPFTMLLLSEAAAKEELRRTRQSCEAMYTELFPYREYTVSLNKGGSVTSTKSLNTTKSESVSAAENVTANESYGESKSRSHTGSADERMEENRAKNQLLGTALSLTAIMTGLGVGRKKMHPLQGLFYGGSISSILSSAQTLLGEGQSAGTQTEGDSKSHGISYSEGRSASYQEGFAVAEGISGSMADSASRTIQMRCENCSVEGLLEMLKEQIHRLQHIEEIGGFYCAAYFVAGDDATALTAANLYRSQLGRSGSLGQKNAVNLWSKPDKIEDICEYLKRCSHPLFYFERRPGYPIFTAAALVSADEMSIYAVLPRKSLSGLPVSVRAEFARDVIRSGLDDTEAGANSGMDSMIEVGNIFHMGKMEHAKVYLLKDDLSGHMFVAGTTGMGKSRFCYGLLESLRKKAVKFMVIEPAKGEYRHVLGGYEDVHVFGTNPDLSSLLKINPFSFPEGIHVNEHIDRLLEIFNSCWPMYAAMPQVLKEGMETVYRQCGYDLVTGRIKGRRRFPSFAALLKVLPVIIRQSEFSGEVQGNYIGSLVTRVKSLTAGLYGSIFTEYEIDAPALFDQNVLIDISRIGSGETKALIMGILIMKLQEYRMSRTHMNTPLSHVTVLEEAHHLLRAAAPASAEGVSLRAMSLEMITNAIAEMRTYGEGFIIADQSPALMDPAVIRNTNTKVIFKLPEQSDRQIAGTAMALTSEQIAELARLEKGTAAILQSGWDNALLAKIRYFDTDQFKPYIHKVQEEEERTAHEAQLRAQCLALLVKERLPQGAQSSFDQKLCEKLMQESDWLDESGRECRDVLCRYYNDSELEIPFAEICKYTDHMLDSRHFLEICGIEKVSGQWETQAKAYIASCADLTDAELRELILLCLNIQSKDSEIVKKMYFQYFSGAYRMEGENPFLSISMKRNYESTEM